ncbi:MAG: hypothetical protein JSW68_07615 [Burkholderiales bacterium]|nr:MAG: hypothetical protein JSW68_07615 [Burkholderiales bacterium]
MDQRAQSGAAAGGSGRVLAQRVMWIAWPAFLMAGVLEMLLFAMVDPADVTWFGEPLAWSRTAIYSVAFFAFWLLMICSSALTVLLEQTPAAGNQRAGAAGRAAGTNAPRATGDSGDDRRNPGG